MKIINKFCVILFGAICSLQLINAAEQTQAEQKKIEGEKQYTQAEKNAALKEAINWLPKRGSYREWFENLIDKYELDPNLIKHRILGSLLFNTLQSYSGPKWLCPEFKFAKKLIAKGADVNEALMDLVHAHREDQSPLPIYTVRLLLDARADASKVPLANVRHLDITQLLLSNKAQVTEDDVWKTVHKNPNVLLAYYAANPLSIKATINKEGSRILREAMNRHFDRITATNNWGRLGVDRLELIPYAQNFVKLGYSIKRKDFDFGYSQNFSTIPGWRRPQNIMEEIQEYIDQAGVRYHGGPQEQIRSLQNDLMVVQVVLAKAMKDSEQQKYSEDIKNLLSSLGINGNDANLIVDYCDAHLTADIVKQITKINQQREAIAADQQFTENLGPDTIYPKTGPEQEALEEQLEAEKADRREQLPQELFKVIPVSPIDKGPLGLIMSYDNPTDKLQVESYEAKIQAEKDEILAQVAQEKADRRAQLPQELFNIIPVSPIDKGPLGLIMEYDDPQDRIIPACVAPYLEHADYTPRA